MMIYLMRLECRYSFINKLHISVNRVNRMIQAL
jgi:hypothetical protein